MDIDDLISESTAIADDRNVALDVRNKYRETALYLRELKAYRTQDGARQVKLIREANEHFSRPDTYQVAMEECGELIVAISHFIRGRPDARDNLIEELADVKLMSYRLMLLLNIAQDVDEVYLRKLEQLGARIRADKAPEKPKLAVIAGLADGGLK